VNWIDLHVYNENSADPSALWRGHHLSFRVSDYDGAIKILKERNVQYFEKTQQDGKVKQAFFFDPDGDGVVCRVDGD
jgi:catechol 2,3-dioxygenase-like lactoylglutathione lyase family enzyme